MVRKFLVLCVVLVGTALYSSALLLRIATTSPLPSGAEGTDYRFLLQARDGAGSPYKWAVTSGSLPTGITLAPWGLLSGAPAAAGSYNFTIRATDSANHTASKSFVLQVAAAASVGGQADNLYCTASRTANFGATTDGPATLPRSCLFSALSSTQSPGATWSVCASGCAFKNLQAALQAAACGDTIELAAGETFTQKTTTFPAKHCDDQHWITVRTSTPDDQLPAEGTRMTPCWAGVGSLPSRPPFACPAGGVPAKSRLAKIVISPIGGQMFIRGDHYRLIGLEVTRVAGGGIVYFFFNVGGGSNVIFDRMWIHGTPRDEAAHGIMLSNSHHVAIVDSYINDFKCRANTGACTDAQTIVGGSNSITGFAGTYKIVNNFLEASGENILLGGGASVDTSGDIEIRRNHFFKPLTWNPAHPSYAGIRWIVKNHLELKNGTRALVEGNIFENVWGGYSQFGSHVLLTPKNQAHGSQNLCSNCFVTQITFRYNRFMTGAQVFQIANGANGNGAYAKAGNSYSIHDNVAENLAYRGCYGCTNQYNQLSTGFKAPASDILANVNMSHNTFVVGTAVEENPTLNAGFMGIGGPSATRQPNMTINDNIFAGGYYGPWSTGGTANCAYNDNSPQAKFNACWSNWKFAGNVVTNGHDIHQDQIWPSTTTLFPPNQAAVGYVSLGTGLGGNYRLSSTSPYKGKASDGKDPGANIDLVDSMTAGVR